VTEPRRILDGFGGAVRSVATFAEPRDTDELATLLQRAAEAGTRVAFRGAGRSYGDASLNQGGLCISLTALNRILAWDPGTGCVDAESGVTIEGVWRRTLPDGHWPPVVPGTMFPTLGGCVAMNIHGKNHFKVGSFGDHVEELDLFTVGGERLTCSRTQHSDVFHAVIGGFGMLGAVTRVRIKTKRVESGLLGVEAVTVPDLEALFSAYEDRVPRADYLVGWVDGFARGRALGRAVLHQANYLSREEDPDGAASLTLEAQGLPPRILGVLPRDLVWRLMRPWVNDPGMRLINLAKVLSSRVLDRSGRRYRQSHVGFAFLLDYVPRWRDTYGRGGFIQVQPFVPREAAPRTFARILERCQARGLVSYLLVFKRHRPDAFLFSHALDGYSLAMDFRVTPQTREAVWALGREIEDLVAEQGGRIYFAKDAVALPGQVAKCFGEERIAAFKAVKRRLDPTGLLSSELSRRVLPDL
jgi:FAD/FMN-containing dehydrogenase